MKLSEIVRRYREEHGLSIRQFAKQCDISHSAIANIENETNSYGEPYIPQLGTINKVAYGMGIPARDLLSMMDGVKLENIKPMLDAVNVESKSIKQNAPKTQNRVKSLEAKLDRLKNLYIDGDISKEIYAEKRDKVKIELEKIRADHAELDYEQLNAILNSGWRSLYDRIDPEDRAHFWRTILHHIEILPDGYKPLFNGPTQ